MPESIEKKLSGKEQEENESIRMYDEFIKCYEKYVSWAKDYDKTSLSAIKSRIDAKVDEVKKLPGVAGRIGIRVSKVTKGVKLDRDCYSYDRAVDKPRDCDKECYSKMLMLTAYTMLCRFAQNAKKAQEKLKEYNLGVWLKPSIRATGTENRGKFSVNNPPEDMGGEFVGAHVFLSVPKSLSCWYETWYRKGSQAKKLCVTHVVDHEFGHYLDWVAARRYDKRKDVEFGIELDKFTKDFEGVIEKIQSSVAMKNPTEEELGEFGRRLGEAVSIFSNRLGVPMRVVRRAIAFVPRNCAVEQMIGVIKELNGGKIPSDGASKYVESYKEKYDDLGNNPFEILNGSIKFNEVHNTYLSELYADSRAKSKARIYKEIREAFKDDDELKNNKLKSMEEWKQFCEVAEYKGDDERLKKRAGLVKKYKEILIKGRGIWGLAFRLLQLDTINLDARFAKEKDIFNSNVEKAYELTVKDIKDKLEIINDYVNNAKSMKEVLDGSKLATLIEGVGSPTQYFYDHYKKLEPRYRSPTSFMVL